MLPETIRVRVSTEDAGYISITPVVVRELPLRELIERMLGITGKQPGRIHELLLRGTLVSGASRLRWAGWDADCAALESLLATFPDPDPSRPFTGRLCMRAVLKGPACRIDLPRDIGAERRWLRRRSFWDVLMEVAAAGVPRYLDYSYAERADRYLMDLTPAAADQFRQRAAALRYSRLEYQVRSAAFDCVEFYVARGD